MYSYIWYDSKTRQLLLVAISILDISANQFRRMKVRALNLSVISPLKLFIMFPVVVVVRVVVAGPS